MPIMLYPKCWRGRQDCQPIHCVDGVDHELTEEEYYTLSYTPSSFVCCGRNESREVERDIYRLCFKNDVTDEMTDNDMQDLTSIVSVIGAALNLDACQKATRGIVEIPVSQDENNQS